MKIKYIISIDLPCKASIEDGRKYILDAVTNWCGSLEPPNRSRGDYPETFTVGDPMFDLNRESVKVVKFLV